MNINRFYLILAMTMLWCTSIFAQPLTYAEQSFSIGLGVPAISNYDYSSRSPALTAIYEYGFSDKLGIGYVGGGALLSFAGSDYDYRYLDTPFTSEYNYVVIGPRAAYHFDMVEITGDSFWSNIDVYGGMFLGIRFQSYKYTNHSNGSEQEDNKSKLATDIFTGIRYSFHDQIGAFAELGYGVAYLNLGVNIRF
jgi:hypothetical protein